MQKIKEYFELFIILFGKPLEWIFFIVTSIILVKLAPSGETLLNILDNQYKNGCFILHGVTILAVAITVVIYRISKEKKTNWFLFFGTITMWLCYIYDTYFSIEKIQHIYEVEAMIAATLITKLISYYIKDQLEAGGIEICLNQKNIEL